MKRETPGVSSETIKCSPLGPTWASVTLRQLRDDIQCAIQFDASTMITGERGVGKKFVAALIHEQSRRCLAPFGIVRSSDIVEFRHALSKTGNNGTLLIDDIQNIPGPMQLELQRFIESQLKNRDRVRLMTTGGTDLFERVRSNRFPGDLFYRLNVIHLVIPALRDRPEDIPTLFRHYLSSYAHAEPPQLTTAAWDRLINYPWPGNVRELKAVAEKVAGRHLGRPVEMEDLPLEVSRWCPDPRIIH